MPGALVLAALDCDRWNSKPVNLATIKLDIISEKQNGRSATA
jgi:hypothetical protein